jgi:polysaccharide export outer membrane protein
MNSGKAYLLSIALLTVLISCTGIVAQVSPENKEVTKPDTIKVIPAGGQAVESLKPGADRRNERYKIGFEDVLQVQVYRHPELSQTVKVARDGTITLPRIDQPITAICKSERELASLVTKLYRNYLRNPFVNVRALEQRSQPFHVIGSVNKPGSFYLNKRVRLLELIAIAGGPDQEFAGPRVRVSRLGNLSACKIESEKDDDIEFFSYSMSNIMKGIENPYLQPGDVVAVLEAEEAFIVGNVEEPTTIKLKEPITLTQAIAKAGGLGPVAKTSKIIIQRRESGSKIKTELVFDLKEIRAQKVQDPYLQANDIVEVPTNNRKVLRNGLIKVLTGGLSNIFYRFPL